MVAAVRVHKPGGPEVLTYEEADVPAPGPGQIRVKQGACGLNFIDVYFRAGLYAAPSLPFIPGNEGAGTVTAVGPDVKDIKTGDRVALRPSGCCPPSARSSCPTGYPMSRRPA
jgi:NADPH2:quinone reductase